MDTEPQTAAGVVFDATVTNFETSVIHRSVDRPVLVDFWAAWCGPCRSLTPVLTTLVESYAGKLTLAKVNTDQEQELATRFQVRSLPTVMLFRDSKIVDQFMGAQPESVIKEFLEPHVAQEWDVEIASADAVYAAGDTDSALDMLSNIVSRYPHNDRAKFRFARWLLPAGRIEECEQVLATLSPGAKSEAGYRELSARLHFARVRTDEHSIDQLAGTVRDNEIDLDARYQLASRLIQDDQFQPALDQLLEIIKRDRGDRRDDARRGILMVFDLLGGTGELVTRYRSLLARSLN